MIIIKLKGGLGNQMFQYACGRAFSLRAQNILKLDISGFHNTSTPDTPRNYSLSHFLIIENLATAEEIKKNKYPLGIISKFFRFTKVKLLRKFNMGFEKSLFDKVNDLKPYNNFYLDGFFQTEKYFTDYADVIRKEFTLKAPLSPSAEIFANKIKITNSSKPTVSLHVRRGDVAKAAWKNPYYGITTPEYYEKALKTLVDKLGTSNVHIFVFSDDIEWTKQNIKIPFPTTFVEGVGIADYEELNLMSMCNHNIIANSSFSWWGAWLNNNPDKIVIAPKQWIRKRQWQHKDICPSSWIRV